MASIIISNQYFIEFTLFGVFAQPKFCLCEQPSYHKSVKNHDACYVTLFGWYPNSVSNVTYNGTVSGLSIHTFFNYLWGTLITCIMCICHIGVIRDL